MVGIPSGDPQTVLVYDKHTSRFNRCVKEEKRKGKGDKIFESSCPFNFSGVPICARIVTAGRGEEGRGRRASKRQKVDKSLLKGKLFLKPHESGKRNRNREGPLTRPTEQKEEGKGAAGSLQDWGHRLQD